METEFRRVLGFDESFKVIYTNFRSQRRKDQETYIYCYDVLDSEGDLVAKCEIQETSNGALGSQTKRITYKRFSPEGAPVPTCV